MDRTAAVFEQANQKLVVHEQDFVHGTFAAHPEGRLERSFGFWKAVKEPLGLHHFEQHVGVAK